MHWRYTANRILLGFLDAMVFVPMLIVLIDPFKGSWTFKVLFWGSIVLAFGLVLLDRRGFTPNAMYHLTRARIGQWLGRGMRPIGHPFETQRRSKR